ncbi:unnamed protein product [Calypogeia fissa]
MSLWGFDGEDNSLTTWSSLTQESSSVAVLRVNQMDAARLDEEMKAMLKEQLLKVFSLAQSGLLLRYEPELNAFLDLLIWRLSIWVDRPTPGNALMDLRYRNERSYDAIVAAGRARTGLEGEGLTKFQKLCYCLAMVGGNYGWTRLQLLSTFQRWGHSERNSWPRRIWALLQKSEGVYKVADCVNVLVFLYTGRYRTIIERVLKARLIFGGPRLNRLISFEYMNRQLVWHEFSELLLLMLPLLKMISFKKILAPFSSGQTAALNLREDACPICEASPVTVPYTTIPCGHLYCYFCLRTRCISNSSFHCLKCNTQVGAIKRHHTQVSFEGDKT